MEFSNLKFAMPRIAGNNKEDLSFQHKNIQEETNIHSCMENEESATEIMILETGKTELRNFKFKHLTFCNLGNCIQM